MMNYIFESTILMILRRPRSPSNDVKGLPKALSCVFPCQGVVTAMKTHETLRRMLVYRRKKCEVRDTAGVPDPLNKLSKDLHRKAGRRFGAQEKEYMYRRDGNC